jgi:hypothetical protein
MEELDSYVHFTHHPADIKKMIKLMKNTMLVMPKDHDEEATKPDIHIWEKEVDMFVKQQETYNNNKCALYSVIWGQCSEAMQLKIKSDDLYDTMHEDRQQPAISFHGSSNSKPVMFSSAAIQSNALKKNRYKA